MKYTIETKLKAVIEHVEAKATIKELQEKYGIQPSKLKYLTALYRRYGPEPFLKSREGQNKFSKETKLKMIRRYLNGESGYSLALELKSIDQTIVRDWTKLYLNGGEAAIRDSKSRKSYKLKHEREQLVAHNKLLKRNEFLEAENEVLKKWYTLILQRSESLKTK